MKLHHETHGTGDPILFLHGFGLSGRSWNRLIPFFKHKHKLFLLDLKGHGKSPSPRDDDYSIFHHAEHVIKFIQSRKLKNLTLVGHSLGGCIALITALKFLRKEQVLKKLVIIGGVAYAQKLPWFIKLLQNPSLKHVEKYLPGKAHALVKTAKHLVPEHYNKLQKQFKFIKIPTLLIWGKDDKIVPLNVGKKLNKEIRSSELVVFERCGHVPQIEQAKKTATAIIKFLKSNA